MTPNPTAAFAALVGLPRYTGMDAWAQDIADRHAPLDKGVYAEVDGGHQPGTVLALQVKASALLHGYHKIGIGYDNGYWVVVLKN